MKKQKEKEKKYSIKELNKIVNWLYIEGNCIYPYNSADEFVDWFKENPKEAKRIVLEEKKLK